MHAIITVVAVLCAVDSACAAALIAQDIYVEQGAFPRDSQPDGNSVLIVAGGALVVVDTGRHVDHTKKLIEFASARSLPIAAVLNTHWHLDHVGGNFLLRQRIPSLKIYATDALTDALPGFLANYRRQLQQAIAQAGSADTREWRTELELIEQGDSLKPTNVVESSSKIKIAGRRFRMHVEQAATSGDLWIEDPASRTLIAGDLITLPVPFFDTACVSEWSRALERMSKVRFTALIPGHGRPLTRPDFLKYKTAFHRLLTCADSNAPVRQCSEMWQRDAKGLIDPADLDRIEPMLDYYFKSLLRTAPSERMKHCAQPTNR